MAEEEKPTRRRRRRSKASEPEEATAPAAETTSENAEEAQDDAPVDEVEARGDDVEAEEAASDVMLEADAEAEGEDSEEEMTDEAVADEAPQAEAPRRSRRLRRGAAEPKAEEKRRVPAKPAPARRRSKRDPNLPPPVVRAQAKYVRSSARKARLVCDHIRGKSVEDARAILAHTPRAVARDWSKLLESAIANAENNHELVGEDLYIKSVHADEGPTIKRFRPRAMGRATRIRKRTSHLTILLTPKE
jgi:ribosomal protein L22